MVSRRVYVICGLLCVLTFVYVSDSVAQTVGSPTTLPLDTCFGQGRPASGPSAQRDCWSTASVHVGWMTAPNRIRVGYDGLVPPGACVSSYFVYPLSGVQVGGSLPIRLAEQYVLRLYGTYLIPYNSQTGQEITWTNNPPGVREWRGSHSQSYKLGAEGLYRLSCDTGLVAGFRWESLLSNFSDPNPSYLFTISEMEAQNSVTFYEPYVGIRMQFINGLTVQVAGFPCLLASVQHLNVCNNNGVPFAHTGINKATSGYFVEATVEYRVGRFHGMEALGFVDWNVYQGRCPMTIERHEGGPHPGTTSATVDWSHQISSLVLGGRIEFSWNLSF
jgi:hypothetical protein